MNFTAGSTSLTDVRDAINNANIGVTANIIEVSEDNFSLMVKSAEGENRALRIESQLSGAENNVLKYNPGNTASLTDSATQVVTATNANFTVDGIAVERTSNTVTDLFSGVTLELRMYRQATSAQINLSAQVTQKQRRSATLETVVSEINYLLAF